MYMYKYQVREVEYKSGGVLKVKVSEEASNQINKVLDEMASDGWELFDTQTTLVNAFTHSVLLFFRKA